MANHLRAHRRLWLGFMMLLSLFTLSLAACGPSHSSNPSSSLTIVANTSGDLVRNFNPYSPSVTYGSQGTIYETLLFFNRVDNSITPWLATDYKFSGDAKTLTFTLRPNVKWADGQPFTASDVVFTLNTLKKYPAMDVNSVWPFISSVTAPDPMTVQITLNQAFSPILWYIGGQTWILPEHLWSNVGDASTYADPNPIGTGPYVLGSFTPQLEVLTRNTHFWQPGKPAVKELRFPAFNSNVSAELVLNTGNLDWTGLYTPDIEKTYIARDKTHNHYWFPPSDIVMLYLNLTKAPFNNLAVRQAMSYAIDRNKLYHVAESGYEPVASPTGLVLPADNSYVAPQYANAAFTLDVNKATSLLQSAGYTKGSDGIFADASGKKLSFSLDVIDGYTDWITSCQIIASDLKAIGMNVSVNTVAYDAFYNDLQVGNFDTAIWGTNAGPSPYFIYDSLLRSDNSAAIGQAANSNFERWIDKPTDALLQQYAQTADPTIQQQAIAGLETIMVNDLPSIPLMNEPYWYEYSTAHWTGWPDPSHPYAEPSPYTYPDSEVVILHLQPTS